MVNMAGREFSRGEELVHVASHAIGLGASVAGLPILVLAARASGDAGDVVGCSIFGATLILLYGTSTLYHALIRSRAKRIFGVLDHAAIYLLIAGESSSSSGTGCPTITPSGTLQCWLEARCTTPRSSST